MSRIDSNNFELTNFKAVAHDFEGSSVNCNVDCCENILDKVFMDLDSLYHA